MVWIQGLLLELVVYATKMQTAGCGDRVTVSIVSISSYKGMGGQWGGHCPELREGWRVHTHTAICQHFADCS